MFRYIKVDDLKVNPDTSDHFINAVRYGRPYDRKKINDLKKSNDRTFIIVSKNLEVLDGHHRLKAFDKKRILCWVWPDGDVKPSYENILKQNTTLENLLSGRA